MSMVHGNVWGIWWWRITAKGIIVDNLRKGRCSLPRYSRELARDHRKQAAGVHEQLVKRGVPQAVPVELMYSGTIQRTGNRFVVPRQWNGFVCSGSLCVVGSDWVCAPEFCYLQVCGSIRFTVRESLAEWQYLVILVELGCELCGTYSKAISKRGFKDRITPLCSTRQLLEFLGRMAFEYGASRAFDALRWILDGLRSPMETVLYLMLCMPQHWGGLALPRPYANYGLEVPEHLWDKTSKRTIVPDLFWPEANLAIEYDSDEEHTGRDHEDQERQELAQDMGLKVITFRNSDMANLTRFNAKARSVATYLGWGALPLDAAFLLVQKTLRDMLMYHERWI